MVIIKYKECRAGYEKATGFNATKRGVNTVQVKVILTLKRKFQS